MNISFINKIALGVLLVATCIAVFWRYEVTVIQPRQNVAMASFHQDLRDREKLKEILGRFKDLRVGVERITSEGKLNEEVVVELQNSLSAISSLDPRLLGRSQSNIKAVEADINEFLKITNQVSLYEAKVKEFTGKFAVHFQVFENDIENWKKTSAGTMMVGGEVLNTLPVSDIIQKISTLQKIIPELSAFEKKLKDLQTGLEQWTKGINAAADLETKQAVFGQGQYLLKAFPSLFATFNTYMTKTLEKESANVRQIGIQIIESIESIEQPLREEFGSLNNGIETQIIQARTKEYQYRELKRAATLCTFVVLIFLFFGMTIYAFRFERGLAFFKKQAEKASDDSKEITASLNDHAGSMIRNFELARTYKDGLEEVAENFTDRQLNLQHIDQLVRDTDLLIKESRENFQSIKEEFYNTEKVSQEIVQLTGALNGVAQQMTLIAERATQNVATNSQQAEGKQNTIDELKYLSSRIRYAVGSTHSALETRKDKIDEAKEKFDLIEKNMDQMTDNTREALKEIALARLDHSQEASRINEILESAKVKSHQIADEINVLNRQIRDFSVLSKHLDALHELAVKASALNAQSLMVDTKDSEAAPVLETSSRRMNDYIQEYFTKVFESDVLKPADKDVPVDSGLSEASSQKPASRIEQTVNNS